MYHMEARMDFQRITEVARLPKEEGYVGGFRIHKHHDKYLRKMSYITGLSKTHCLEVVLAEAFKDIPIPE